MKNPAVYVSSTRYPNVRKLMMFYINCDEALRDGLGYGKPPGEAPPDAMHILDLFQAWVGLDDEALADEVVCRSGIAEAMLDLQVFEQLVAQGVEPGQDDGVEVETEPYLIYSDLGKMLGDILAREADVGEEVYAAALTVISAGFTMVAQTHTLMRSMGLEGLLSEGSPAPRIDVPYPN